jgi:hypothetical protein
MSCKGSKCPSNSPFAARNRRFDTAPPSGKIGIVPNTEHKFTNCPIAQLPILQLANCLFDNLPTLQQTAIQISNNTRTPTMISPKQYQELKTKIDNFQSKIARLQGQQEEIKRTLQAEFNVTTIEEAKSLQNELQTKYEKASSKFQTTYDNFTEKYADLL